MTGLADRAIRWFDTHARDLPWRRPSATPWGVLVSEVMLQQTPVPRVAPVWDEWLRRWPSPGALAADPAGEAVRAWGRLGYPRRALRLHACATVITARHAGSVPADLAELLALPGIGAYTARAVATFAYGQRHPVVDTNVRRLVARAVAGQPHGGPTTSLADLMAVERLLPAAPARAARASAAFMELGAVVCVSRAPDCPSCPLRATCAYRRAGAVVHVPGGSRPQRYEGTDRQARGALLARVRDRDRPVSRVELLAGLADPDQAGRALRGLLADGLIIESIGDHFGLPGLG